MKELLISIAQGLVDDPSAVSVTEDAPNEEGTVVYHLHVSESDMGRVIGEAGQDSQGYPHGHACSRYPP